MRVRRRREREQAEHAQRDCHVFAPATLREDVRSHLLVGEAADGSGSVYGVEERLREKGAEEGDQDAEQ